MSFNLASQLFGSKMGHQINSGFSQAGSQIISSPEAQQVISNEEATVLSKLGVPSSIEGAIQFVEAKVDAAIESETQLNATEKLVLEGLINSLATRLESQYTGK